MRERNQPSGPQISVIVPVVERHGDLRHLYLEYSNQLQAIEMASEFVFVVDQRQREVIPVLRQIQQEAGQNVTLVVLGGAFGESAALKVGLQEARGEIVVTLASYFQVDPSGLQQALQFIEEGSDLVVGRRYPRRDSLFNRLQSWVFHRLVRLFTSARFSDISCGFRVMNRVVLEELEVYGGLHRFIPIFAQRAGFAVHELKLAQREEDRPTRYYGLALYLKRLLDIVTVFFLLKFTHRPLRFFGLVGILVSAIGFLITGYLGLYRMFHFGPIADRPLLLLGVLLIVLGIQILSIGLIGEIIIFTHARKTREFRIAEVIRNSVSESKPFPVGEAEADRNPDSDRMPSVGAEIERGG